MARKYTRSKKKRTRYRLSPKEADEVIRAEFTDSRGNKVHLNVTLRPHSPSEPTFKWKREYNDEMENNK